MCTYTARASDPYCGVDRQPGSALSSAGMELVSGVISPAAAVDKCRKGAIRQGTVLHSRSFSSVRSSFAVVWKVLLF